MNKSYRLKIDIEKEKAANEALLNYNECMSMLNSIIENYVIEDQLIHPYSGNYIPEKAIMEMIKDITEKIISEMSNGLYVALSYYIKPSELDAVINRKVAIEVTAIVSRINNENINKEVVRSDNDKFKNQMAQMFNDLSRMDM